MQDVADLDDVTPVTGVRLVKAMPPDYMGTATGARVFLLAPERSDIRLLDIAIALSRVVRFNGHSDPSLPAYSVAQHAVLVSHLCPPDVAREGLHHDDAEYVLGDVVSPWKLILGEAYAGVERRWELALSAKFGTRLAWSRGVRGQLPEVKQADRTAFVLECHDLLAPDVRRRAIGDVPRPQGPRIRPLSADDACAAFLRRHWELTTHG